MRLAARCHMIARSGKLNPQWPGHDASAIWLDLTTVMFHGWRKTVFRFLVAAHAHLEKRQVLPESKIGLIPFFFPVWAWNICRLQNRGMFFWGPYRL